jgi:hypothetical protein
VETLDVEVANEGKIKRVLDFGRNPIVHSKILHHFIKGKISLSPMEPIFAIPDGLKSLEILVKLARRKHDEEQSLSSPMHAVRKININQNHRNKTLCTSFLK